MPSDCYVDVLSALGCEYLQRLLDVMGAMAGIAPHEIVQEKLRVGHFLYVRLAQERSAGRAEGYAAATSAAGTAASPSREEPSPPDALDELGLFLDHLLE